MKSINRIAIINVVSTIILQGIAFFTAPIFSRLLGTDNYGIVSVYRTWVSLASTVLTLQAASTIANARSQFDLKDQDKYQSSVLSLTILIYCVLSGITLGICYIISDNYKHISMMMVICILVQGLGTYIVNIINSKLTYEFKAEKNAYIAIFLSVCNIALSLIFVLMLDTEINYWGKIQGELCTYVLISTVGCIIIFRRGKTFYNREYWLFSLPIAIPTIFHLLANIVLSQSDRLMIQGLLDNFSVGIYSLAATFAGILSSIYGALNNTWVPFYFEFSRLKQFDEIRNKAKNYIELYTVVCCGFMLLTREVYHIIADRTFWGGTNYVIVLALGLYMVFLYSFPVNYEFYHRKTKLIASGTLLAAVFNIVMNYLLIRHIGLVGAVIATTLAYALQFVFHFILAKKVVREEFPYTLKIFLPGIMTVSIVCVFSILSEEYLLIRWGLAAVFGLYLIRKIYIRKSLF